MVKEKQQNSSNIALIGRTIKMKRLDQIVPAMLGPKSEQEEGMIKHEAPHFGEAIVTREQQIPSTEILKFVVDVLQRKDKYQYFAEPVNGDEVEDYYDFIKEPMDFGTMRAKISQGVYTTLKQFQEDVYLICENAMSFNASSTVYYRTARSIKELADKVFNTLETNPENIIPMFSKRKGSVQESIDEPENSGANHDKIKHNYEADQNSGPKHEKEIKRKRSGCRRSTGRVAGKNLACNESESRHTYQHMTSGKQQLVLVGGKESQGFRYKESLMQFAKDLGPVAQKVANQKLLPLNQLQSHSLTVPSLYRSRENANPESNVTPLAIYNEGHFRRGEVVLGLGATSLGHRQR